ncbi:MAG: TIGR04255 family protein [Candidatus Kapabacteria bacterium]|nr:TIGR04255 family protein [Candidatus Kapabacteria bacterium]
MDQICYKKNFITAAIARIDFLNPIDEIDNKLPKAFIDSLKNNFPIAESNPIKTDTFAISHIETKQSTESMIEWKFWNKERNRLIVLTKFSLALSQNYYSTFEEFTYEFETALTSICSVYNNPEIRRFGLRYVNEINISEDKPLKWTNYINKNLIATINFPKEKEKISRTFHNLIMNYDEFELKFNFGMHNADYPAPIKQKNFILDFDATHHGILTRNGVLELLPKFHAKIQDLFEDSILDKLRDKYLNHD